MPGLIGTEWGRPDSSNIQTWVTLTSDSPPGIRTRRAAFGTRNALSFRAATIDTLAVMPGLRSRS